MDKKTGQWIGKWQIRKTKDLRKLLALHEKYDALLAGHDLKDRTQEKLGKLAGDIEALHTTVVESIYDAHAHVNEVLEEALGKEGM